MQLPYYIQEEYQITLYNEKKISFNYLQCFRRLALGEETDHTKTPVAGWPLQDVDVSLPSYEDAAIAAASAAASESLAALAEMNLLDQTNSQRQDGS